MSDMLNIEHGGTAPINERRPSSINIDKASHATTINRLRNLVPEKARHALRFSTQKSALTASGLYLLVSLGCGNTESPAPTSISSPPPITDTFVPPSTSELTHTSFPEPKPNIDYDYQTVSGVKIAFDKKSGLPIKYTLENGKEVILDMEEVGKLKEKAIVYGEPEIVKMILVENTPQDKEKNDPGAKSREHPISTELPNDTLSEQDLEQRGVTILQGNDTNLYIREGAFSKEGLLANFNNTGRKLTIVLDPKYLSDSRYGIRERLPMEYQSLQAFRTAHLKTAEGDLRANRNYMEAFKRSTPTVNANDAYELPLLYSKMEIYKYQTLLTDQQVQLQSLGASYYFPFPKDPIVYLNLDNRRYNLVTIFIDYKGYGKTKSSETDINKLLPKAEQSHPNPSDFPVEPSDSPHNPKSYPYLSSVYTPGFVLRHEISHDELIQQKINRGETPNESEYDADMKAMQGIRWAWERWEKSGFTDNSGYNLVFSLAPEKGGGYILTEHKQPDASTSRKT